MPRRTVSLLGIFVIIAFSLVACNSDGPPPAKSQNQQTNNTGNSPQNGNTSGSSELSLTVSSDPDVSWNEADSTTTVTVQFVVRDGDGVPLEEDEYDVSLLVNDLPVNSEAMLGQESEELEVNLYLSMVLDASSSMLLHTPSAFAPMTQAAENTYQEAKNLWLTRPGEIKFSAIWFNNLINQSHDDEATKIWQPSDLSSISSPPPSGAFTKLYSAISVMTEHLQSEYTSGVFNGSRDQYVMLIFSDGDDTYSHVDNAETNPNQLRTTLSGASFHEFGTVATTIEDTTALVQSHPRLTTHVIGLGSEINKAKLEEIANAGNGVFLENPSSEKIDELFDRVMKEFTTMQTNGVKFPFLPGEHKFTLRVTDKTSEESDDYTFNFRAGEDAQLLP